VKASAYQKYIANRPIPQLDEFAKRTGLDVRTQVWEVLYVSDGKSNVVLGRGKFATEAEPRLPDDVLPPGSTRFNYRNYNFTGTDKSAVVFLAPTVAGVGDTALLKHIIDSREKSNGPPQQLADRMKEVPPEAAIWAVFLGSPFPAMPQKMGAKGDVTVNMTKVLNYIDSGSFYLDLRQGGNGRATTTSANDADAKQLSDALKGMIGLARMMTPQATGGKPGAVPQLMQLLDHLRITQEAQNVNLYIDQPESVIEQLFQLIPAAKPAQ
jgi:hypothetical protein